MNKSRAATVRERAPTHTRRTTRPRRDRRRGTRARRTLATEPRSHGATKRRGTRRVRRITIVTGSRAEYGLLRSTIRAVHDHPRLKLQLVVAGIHLLKKFGSTVHAVEDDGWRIDARVRMQRGDDSPLDQAQGLGRGVAGIARFLQGARSDIVVVLGDRIEALAGALAGVTTGRLVAHIHGGDVAPGDFDDNLRHAITKLAHLHLTATEAARQRVLQMGEAPDRVHCVGAPGLDRLREIKRSRVKVQSSKKRLALVVQHPCGRSATQERAVMGRILSAVEGAELDTVCVYPNSDRGHSGIVQAIEVHRRRTSVDRFRVVRSLDHDSYLRLLIAADVLVGNSSSGMIEAASAGTLAVNVGDRQRGRECDERFVIHARETAESIRFGLRKALRVHPVMGQPRVYGDGRAGRRIAQFLATIPVDDAQRRKVFTDA